MTSADFNGVASTLGVSNGLSYWRDFDSDGEVNVSDYNMVYWHVNHNCGSPNNP